MDTNVAGLSRRHFLTGAYCARCTRDSEACDRARFANYRLYRSVYRQGQGYSYVLSRSFGRNTDTLEGPCRYSESFIAGVSPK